MEAPNRNQLLYNFAPRSRISVSKIIKHEQPVLHLLFVIFYDIDLKSSGHFSLKLSTICFRICVGYLVPSPSLLSLSRARNHQAERRQSQRVLEAVNRVSAKSLDWMSWQWHRRLSVPCCSTPSNPRAAAQASLRPQVQISVRQDHKEAEKARLCPGCTRLR